MRFELCIATRYLRAKRRQAFIGIITGISIAGVAAGVASLVVAMAITSLVSPGSPAAPSRFHIAHQPAAHRRRRHPRLARPHGPPVEAAPT